MKFKINSFFTTELPADKTLENNAHFETILID